MSSSPSVPPPADAPDDGYNATWDPETFPDTIAGVVESRNTLKFRTPRGEDGERTTFEKLVIQQDGELIDVLGGRAALARLIAKHDPRPGDAIAITAFGKNEKGAFQCGMNVDKRARTVNGDPGFGVKRSEAAQVSRAVNEPLRLGDEENASWAR
jgi:hypothetical protein